MNMRFHKSGRYQPAAYVEAVALCGEIGGNRGDPAVLDADVGELMLASYNSGGLQNEMHFSDLLTCDRGSLRRCGVLAQIGAREYRIRAHGRRLASVRDRSRLQNIAAVGNRKRECRHLVDEEDGCAFLAQLGQQIIEGL